jgi:hypothetical protein
MGRTTIAQAGATGARVLMKGALVSVFVLVAALKTSASTSACGGKSCLPASDYDQSCTQDSDCVGITEGELCTQGCIGCVNAAINVRDQAKYQSAVSGFSGTCSCPSVFIGCNAGTCGLATFPLPSDAGSLHDAPDTCAPSGCTGSCLSLNTHNVSTVVDGCLVWHCCVPDDAGVTRRAPLPTPPPNVAADASASEAADAAGE